MPVLERRADFFEGLALGGGGGPDVERAEANVLESLRARVLDERHRGHHRRSGKRFLKLAVASLLAHENIPGAILPEQELEHGEQVRFAGAEVSLQEKARAFVARHGVEERCQDEIAVGRQDEIFDDLSREPLVGQVGELDDGADRGKLDEVADAQFAHGASLSQWEGHSVFFPAVFVPARRAMRFRMP